MHPMTKIMAAGIAAAFAATIVDAPSEARERGAARTHHVKKTRLRHRVAQRPFAPYAAPADVPSVAYAGPPLSGRPYGGPGRAYFDPPTVGAAPDRAESRSPEGR
jgi:hypothetical protein